MGFKGARKWIVDYGSNYDNPSDCFKVGSNRINKEAKHLFNWSRR